MGELHLEVAAERLERDFGARFRTGHPASPTTSSFSSSASATERSSIETSAASVRGRRSPFEWGRTLAPRGDERPRLRTYPLLARLPPSIISAARRGAEAALSVGPTAGFPLEGARSSSNFFRRCRGARSHHPGSWRSVLWEIAPPCRRPRPARGRDPVVEPVMRIEMTVPQDPPPAPRRRASGRGRPHRVDGARSGGGSIYRRRHPCGASSDSRANSAPPPRQGRNTRLGSCDMSPCRQVSPNTLDPWDGYTGDIRPLIRP